MAFLFVGWVLEPQSQRLSFRAVSQSEYSILARPRSSFCGILSRYGDCLMRLLVSANESSYNRVDLFTGVWCTLGGGALRISRSTTESTR